MRKVIMLLAALLAWGASPAAAQTPAKPLFASDEMIHLTIRADLGGIARADGPRPATLTVEGSAPETHAIELTARGVTRRRSDICSFPPLRIQLPSRPESGLFEGQKRLKLVTHCQSNSSYQRFVLLEYAAYRLYNALTPLGFRVRLAEIEYYDGNGSRPTTRYGFLIEDVDDAAERNGMVEVETPNFPVSWLDPSAAARVAVFEYMISNLDWALQAGTAGEDCCHNTRPVGASETARSGLVPLPYDFDYSGLVSAPYAAPPEGIRVSNVRTRMFRGYCSFNAETRAAAAEFRAARSQIEAVLTSIDALDDGTRRRSLSYLAQFFEDIATPAAVETNLVRNCLS